MRTFVFLFLLGGAAWPCFGEWVEKDPNVSHSLNGVAFGNDIFVAVGDYGEITYSSDDGENWNRVHSGGDSFYAVAYGNGTFVAVGKDGRVCRSSNGTTWTDQSPISSETDLNGIAFGNGVFVAVGEDGHAYWSTGGASCLRFPLIPLGI